MLYVLVALAAAGAVIATGCFAVNEEAADRVSGSGTVTYIDLEGGFYGIVGDDGEHYLPLNLSEEYRKNGMRVSFEAGIQEDAVTIHQWGTPIEIETIEPLDEPGRITGTGTIVYIDLEGGFYGIAGDDGGEYLPLNLDREFWVNGTRVAFEADAREDAFTIQMWGRPIELTSISAIAETEVVAGNGTIVYIDLEGGFYGIVGDDGGEYLPLNLDEAFAMNGTRVAFAAEVMDVATIQMWGTPVEILAMSEKGQATYVAGRGTVTFVDLEGGFYGIVGDDGRPYLPLNLSERYRVDGMSIVFAGRVAEDTATIQMWGTPIEILDVPWASQSNATAGGTVTMTIAGIPNPAAAFCIEQGCTCEIRKNPDGSEYGVCILPDGSEIDEWEYYRQHHGNTP
ncbi:MAG: DUF333 domain-containing protein [Methanomicrobiaceae archaeon]|nr:DUF333 domain-containing protein [Methanomicrobiaceae archaeon]